MKISELIRVLRKIKKENGDFDVHTNEIDSNFARTCSVNKLTVEKDVVFIF